MKTIGVFFISFLAPVLVVAQQLELPLPNPNAATEVDRILASIYEQKPWEVFAVSNGDFSVTTFDPAQLDENAVLAELEVGLPNGDSDCVYETSSGPATWKELIGLEKWASSGDDSKGLDVLTALHATNQTLFIATRGWDGSSGDSEYCQKFSYEVFFKNGKHLYINYDITD